MESNRQKKIASVLQRDLVDVLQSAAKSSMRGVIISVTKVSVTVDLSIAKVYLSIFPSDQSEAVLQMVKVQTKNMRRLLGNRVGKQLRIVPALTFFVDDSLDYIANIDSILNE